MIRHAVVEPSQSFHIAWEGFVIPDGATENSPPGDGLRRHRRFPDGTFPGPPDEEFATWEGFSAVPVLAPPG